MYHNFPYFIGEEEVVLIRTSKSVYLPDELINTVEELLKSLQLVNALRALHVPSSNIFLDEQIDKFLREKISLKLVDAAQKTENKALKTTLLERASALQKNEYSDASYISSQEDTLPIEFMIGLLPSWRYEKKPKTYSGLIAVPDYSDNGIISFADTEAISFAKEIALKSKIDKLDLDRQPPKQITCDVIALAGDFSAHPMHIAHFLPEDEGNYNTVTLKTLLYRNIYLTRYKKVSIPLASSFISSSSNIQVNNDEYLWIVLSLWFRGHDLGHIYFDSFCKQLPGFKRKMRYALQEMMADLFGFILVIRYAKTSESDSFNIRHVINIYFSELLRYMTRDLNLFPDSKSACFQFNYLIKEQCIKINKDNLILDFENIVIKLNDLLYNLFNLICNKQSAYLELMFDNYINEGSLLELFAKYIKYRYIEIDPIFPLSDNILSNNHSKNPINSVRSNLNLQEFDGKRRY